MKKRFLPILLIGFLATVETSARTFSFSKPQSNTISSQDTPDAKIDTWYGLPVISWQEFKKFNEDIKQGLEDVAQSIQEKQSPSETPQPLTEYLKILTMGQGIPSYSQIIDHVKYIYIGETHHEPIINWEIWQLIGTIRQTNPNKKILLATEFLKTNHPLINPLHRYARKESILSNTYEDITELAAGLQMDTLALDDNIIQIIGQNALIKMGDRYVLLALNNLKDIKDISSIAGTYQQEITISPNKANINPYYFLQPQDLEEIYDLVQKDATSKQNFKNLLKTYDSENKKFLASLFIKESTLAEFYKKHNRKETWNVNLLPYIESLIGISAWGIMQRNYQWAERIKRAEKKYDIIIVWGGMGHVSPIQYNSLFYLGLEMPNSILISFWPKKPHMDQEIKQKYQQQAEVADQLDFLTETNFFESPEGNKIFEQIRDHFSIDTGKSYYIKQEAGGSFGPKTIYNVYVTETETHGNLVTNIEY